MTNEQFIKMLCVYWNTDENTIIDKLITEIREKNEPLLNELMGILKQICEPKTDKIVFDEKGITVYKDGAAITPTVSQIETPEKPRKKPGRKPKNFVEDTVREVRQAEKMSRDEFVDYFGGKS